MYSKQKVVVLEHHFVHKNLTVQRLVFELLLVKIGRVSIENIHCKVTVYSKKKLHHAFLNF